MRLSPPALAAWTVLAGCSRTGEVLFPYLDTANPGTPQVAVSPSRLSFPASTGPQFETFSISNKGDGDLGLLEMTLAGDTSFALLGDPPPSVIAPGTGAEVVVQYDSSDTWATASIWLRTDDPLNPIEQIFLEGEPIAPALFITPSELDFADDFGVLTPGCEVEYDLVLINLGLTDLELQNLQYSTENHWLRISNAPQLPLILPPKTATTITVSFAPQGEGGDAGALLIFSNDPAALATATQVGQAAWEWVHVEGITLQPVDLVLAVDHSASMVSVLENLASYADTLVQALDDAGLDWQVSVVAKDSACLHAGPISSSSGDPAGSLSDGLQSSDMLQYTDRMLSMLHQAVLRADDGDCNEGMLREDAVLHGVVITNVPHPGPETALYYVEELGELVGPSERLGISAIAGDLPSGCPGALPGTGYDDAVDATGGRFLSICTDLDELGQLAAASRRAVVQLPSPADPTTIMVRVDGVGWTDGWRLDPIRDMVIFEVQPNPDVLVEVDYGVLRCP